ncbi:MAG: preprotein translocase subunit SecG [Planctomycetes bacterium]|nr:preprotein translocase subunit SecG [Planctomycetota bacterium]
MTYFLGWIGFLGSFFLILLILIQRGRGGGLAGAFGGMGGQSAFGTKAGDTFTRITIVAAAIWLLTCMATIKLVNVSVKGKKTEASEGLHPGGDGGAKDAKKDEAQKDAAKDASPERPTDAGLGPVEPPKDAVPIGPKSD